MTEPLAAWAQQSDVLSITGAAVDEDTVLMAQAAIETATQREYQIGRIKPRDLRWLRKAVAYQAAWIPDNIDLFTRAHHTLLQQDGLVHQQDNRADTYLAPLAQRAIRNLSWKRSRSIRVRTPFTDGDVTVNPLTDDSILRWEPLG
jgi:hypothetical protein